MHWLNDLACSLRPPCASDPHCLEKNEVIQVVSQALDGQMSGHSSFFAVKLRSCGIRYDFFPFSLAFSGWQAVQGRALRHPLKDEHVGHQNAPSYCILLGLFLEKMKSLILLYRAHVQFASSYMSKGAKAGRRKREEIDRQ